MAFVRRKGNSYYLVHNVRRDGKVRQLHLARLGERARITDEVVREVTKSSSILSENSTWTSRTYFRRFWEFPNRPASIERSCCNSGCYSPRFR